MQLSLPVNNDQRKTEEKTHTKTQLKGACNSTNVPFKGSSKLKLYSWLQNQQFQCFNADRMQMKGSVKLTLTRPQVDIAAGRSQHMRPPQRKREIILQPLADDS